MSNDGKFSVDLHQFALDEAREQELFAKQNECVFIWTTKAGEPVGVVMCYPVSAAADLRIELQQRRAVLVAIDRPRTGTLRRGDASDQHYGCNECCPNKPTA